MIGDDNEDIDWIRLLIGTSESVFHHVSEYVLVN